MKQIDINCDLGEGGDDSVLMPLITSANIACGGHAGDIHTMRRAVDLAIEFGVNVGAHPSYEDRANFGRAALHVPAEALRASVASQIRSLQQITAHAGVRLRHVKPHGALYNVAARDPVVAGSILDAMHDVDPDLALVTMPCGILNDLATAKGIEVIAEAFADRTYQSDGSLTPRSDPRAMQAHEIDAADQVLWIVRDGCVRTVDGEWIAMKARTICVHGDGAAALPTLRMLRSAIAAAGIAVAPF